MKKSPLRMGWLVLLLTSTLSGAEEPLPSVGSTVDELLAIARQMNPDLAAAALDAEAAAARTSASDALPEPKLLLTLDEISKNSSGWPGRVATTKYTLQQEIPFWGKRDLRKAVAMAEEEELRQQHQERLLELEMKVKVAYADYHRVHLAQEQTEELLRIVRVVVDYARFRYQHGQAMMQEATMAEAERGNMSMEQVRLQKERQRIRARLNALLNRPAHAPLVEHPTLRPLPVPESLVFEQLLPRARSTNPAVHMSQARVQAAEEGLRLAEKSGWPDLELGFGLVERRDEGSQDGYEAMVRINLPWQGEWRRAVEQEANSKRLAAQQRLQGEELRVESALREALSALEEARQITQITRDTLLPQARITLQAALKGYETGNSEALMVLDAVQRLKKFQIELLKGEFEQQVRLAEIERLVGGAL
ncbi:TolC family protein [Candidatus Magnetaquicoccus inordinatus]|uniref:TolC family protein n=1 Tax=Candidatus Magnetaquicoccus inordinatus TaxID=2496818 RepID=UPI00102C747C|nr:TolC family protein [Candidatus Magnetaquicoccus inordinatus]